MISLSVREVRYSRSGVGIVGVTERMYTRSMNKRAISSPTVVARVCG